MSKTPVLLLTDIGADIDDTEALFVLAGAQEHFVLVGCVTSVNDGVARGTLLRGWLRKLRMDENDEIPIFPSIDCATASCIVPPEFLACAKSIGRVQDTPSHILELVRLYGSSLVVICIAPLTAFANAVKLCPDSFRTVKRIYIQGNVFMNAMGRLEPDERAYNFRVDMDAARTVLTYLHVQKYEVQNVH